MYTKCIQNVYKMYTTFRQTFVYVLYTAKFCIQNVYKNLLKCGIHFVYKYFVCILHTSVLIY